MKTGSRFLRKCVSRLALTGIAAGLLAGCGVGGAQSIEGTWVVTDSARAATTTVSHDDVTLWLGKTFSYQPDRAQLAQNGCLLPKYTEETLDEASVEKTYRVDLRHLDFHAGPVTQVRITCESDASVPGQTLLYQNNQAAYVAWNGVFLRLEKSKPLQSVPEALPADVRGAI
ncbi:hypothetical protein OCL06_08465 [Alteromonas sp. ASW11-19]|uniref:Lipoprotein n=1 Tax=Alteromonas salexigens TaxID=2982530 RepID=A0ABT2VMT6_9ALTE|nr:hypothetical protein [Alteromonas salexigens]MCU7554631.1 hypothetical protein [Alteromonas salexigens]